jgi:predicted amidohydrolase YtcJ
MKIFTSILVAFALCTAITAQTVTADLIVINANIHTMDSAAPKAEALAVWGNKILAVGSTAEIVKLKGAKTRVIDAGGKLVMPGFNDAHLHFLEGGAQLSSVDLRDAKTPEEFVARIKAFAANIPKGQWIQGGQWDHENWKPANLPTKELIDAATPDNPVFINRLDGHMALANSLALKLAGVDKNTKDVAGGMIVRDAGGNPTGIFKDAAMDYVQKAVPEPGFEQKLQAAQAATDYAASLGVTSAQDMHPGADVAVYQELLRRGKLKTRLYAGTAIADWRKPADAGILAAFGGDMLRVGNLKGYADGSLGSTTAWLFEPYNDSPNSKGLSSADWPRMFEYVRDADKHGLQVMVHAIGDRANAEVLDIYEKVAKENGARDRRFRIEHAQHLRQQDIARFGQLKVIASMQPFHLMDDGRWAGKRLGQERLKGTYAFRSLLDSGATLAFGTDWPVAPLNPLLGTYGAVTRRTLDDKNPNGWIPEQKISIQETVRAYTWGSAYAEFQDEKKGTLSANKLADFIILSNDIFTIDPTKISGVKVLTTVVDGRVVYESK